jgi:hypothetical protein
MLPYGQGQGASKVGIDLPIADAMMSVVDLVVLHQSRRFGARAANFTNLVADLMKLAKLNG